MKKYIIGSAIMITLLLGAAVPNVKALTSVEAEAIITALQLNASQAAAIRALVPNSVPTGFVFTRNLTVGSTGSDVTALQQFLVSRGFLTMPAGVAYGYFGPLTRSAVAAYQASQGIFPTAGYFGPITMARVNATQPVVVIPPDSDSDREGMLINIDNANDIESEVDEGEEEVSVFGVEFEAEDSNMVIERIDVDFTLADGSNASDDLEDYIQEVSVIYDGRTVATLDVDEAQVDDGSTGDDLTDDDNDVFSFRFAGLNIRANEGASKELYIAVTAVNNVDSDDEDGTWKVIIPDNGIRAIDEAGLSETYVSGSDLNEESFTVGEATGGDIDVIFESSDNIDRTIQVDEEDETDNIEVLAFTLESETSDNVIESINIDFATTTGQDALNRVIRTVTLFADGDEVGSEDITVGANGVGGTVTFDDIEVEIDEDEEVPFTVEVEVYGQENRYASGYAFTATLDRSAIEAEDANNDNVTVSGQDDVGGVITLRTTGISVAVSGNPSAEVLTNVSTTSGDDQGKFVIEFTVSAFEDPAYIELGAVARGTTESDTGVNFLIEDSSVNATTSGTVTGSILSRVSGGSTSGNFIRINAGSSAKFRLTAYLDPTVDAESYRARLYSVNFASSAIDATEQELAVPAENFDTPFVLIRN